MDKRKPEQAVGRPMFVSSWSERHVAFVCGLGTFGLLAHLVPCETGIPNRAFAS